MNRFVFHKLEATLKDKGTPYSLRKGERQLGQVNNIWQGNGLCYQN